MISYLFHPLEVLQDANPPRDLNSGTGNTQPATFMSENSLVIQHATSDKSSEEEAMPLALMILIPILSSGLILVTLTAVCIRRQSMATASAASAASLTASPLVKEAGNNTNGMLMMASSSNVSSNGNMGNACIVDQGSNTTLQTLKRLSALHQHFYAKPWAVSYITSATSGSNKGQNGDHEDLQEDGESW